MDDVFNKALETDSIITTLQSRAAFPDISEAVNQGQIHAGKILQIRARSPRFREWLKSESLLQRDVLVGYMAEFGTDSVIAKLKKKPFTIFGMLAGIAANLTDAQWSRVATISGTAMPFLDEFLVKSRTGWSPVIFGEWLRHELHNATGSSDSESRR